MIFGRKDLRIGLSWAKFDAEADFVVRFPIAPEKHTKNNEKPVCLVTNNGRAKISGIEK